MVVKGRFAFDKRFRSLGTLHKPSQSGLYHFSCTANGTSLTPLYGGFFLYSRQEDYYISLSEPIASTYIVAHALDFAYT